MNVSPLSVHDLCTNRLWIFSIPSILAPLGWRLLPGPASIYQHSRTIRICMSCSLTVHVNEAKLNSTRACGHHFRCYLHPSSKCRRSILYEPAAQGSADPASKQFKLNATCLKSQNCVALSMVQLLRSHASANLAAIKRAQGWTSLFLEFAWPLTLIHRPRSH